MSRDFHRGLLQHQAAKVVIRQIVVGVDKREYRESGESHDEHLDKLLLHGLPTESNGLSSPVTVEGPTTAGEELVDRIEPKKFTPKSAAVKSNIAGRTLNAVSDGTFAATHHVPSYRIGGILGGSPPPKL